MADQSSLMAVAIDRAGLVRGAVAVEVVVSWAVAQNALGRELGDGEGLSAAVVDVARYWRTSERTVWRQLKRFREVFPEEHSPARLAAIAVAQLDEPTPATVGALPIAA